MIRRPPRSTRTDTLFPYTTLFRSNRFSKEFDMPVTKEHREFHPISMDDAGWHLPEGYKPGGGVDERILAGSLDPENRRGSRTRLLRFQPVVRSEERRVGKECVSTCRSGGSPDH